MMFASEGTMHQCFGYAGSLVDSFSFFMFKTFCNALGMYHMNRHVGVDVDLRLTYLFSDKLSSVFNDCNVLLLLGVNLTKESPIINIRITNRIFDNEACMRVGYIGTYMFPKYPVLHIGLSSITLLHFLYGRSSFCYDVSNNKDRATCIMGRSAGIDVYTYTNVSDYFMYTNYLCLHTGDVNRNELCVMPSYNSRTLFSATSVKEYAFNLFVGIDKQEVETTKMVPWGGF